MRIYLCIVNILSAFSVTVSAEIKTENTGETKCSSSLSPYQVIPSSGPKVICAYVSSEKVTWDDAQTRCSLLFARLTQQIYFKSSLRTELLSKGIGILWMGIRRRNNFFVTEYPSKLFREPDSFSPEYWGYHWSDEEPGEKDCVALNISSGSLLTRNCDDTLYFVCDNDGKDITTILGNFDCPESWNLSFPLSLNGRTCVALQNPNSHKKAENICAKYGGQLATFNEYNILSTSKFLSSLSAESFWIEKENFKLCEITSNLKGHMTKISPSSCTLYYPFICVKQYKTEGISVHLNPDVVNSVQSDSDDATDLLTCQLEADLLKNLNIESDLWFQWYKDNLPLSLNSYVIRLSFVGDDLKRDPYISDIASRQGYYHCEVQVPGFDERYSSSKMKFFYSDIATYIVEIHGIKQINDLDYSHQNFLDYMDDFEEASMSNIMKKLGTRYSEAEWDFMSKSISNGEAHMKIVVYIYKTGVEDFDERIACEELKDAFEELHSVPVFMEKMRVYINCEQFPIRNVYVQVIKSLRNIENRLNSMDDKQEYILEKLQYCEESRNTESSKNDFDVELFLNAVEDLKRLEDKIIHETVERRNSEDDYDERERNEYEEEGSSRKRLFGKARNEIESEAVTPYSISHGFPEELNENYIRNPETNSDDKENERNRVVVFKDL